MKLNKAIFLSAGICAAAAHSLAASSEQTGTWVGTMKSTVYAPDGVISKSSTSMIVQIAADDTTTLTLGGLPVEVQSGGFYNASSGSFVYGSSGGNTVVAIVNFTFKGRSIKGSATGATSSGGTVISTQESKIKLKKQ